MTDRFLIHCGIFSSLLYIGMNAFVPMLFDGYSITSQTVSELSAIDAPTRPLWVSLAMFYILLFGAFGMGIWRSSDGNRHLRIVARLILVYVIINFYWPPMHLRGNEPTLTDTLHIVWAMVTILLMMLIMGFGAIALGRLFRIYTIITFMVFIAFGMLIGVEAPRIPENLPTPWIGIWERINIGAFMFWVIAFAIELLQRQKLHHLHSANN
jgi:Protein of unknown function (DUF998)